MNGNMDNEKKLLKAKMLLDTFEIPKRPVAMSAHQYKKKFGSNQGYAAYRADIMIQRKNWDRLYKNLHKTVKIKNKYLAEINLSDEAMVQAEYEAEQDGLTVPEVLSKWLEIGRNADL